MQSSPLHKNPRLFIVVVCASTRTHTTTHPRWSIEPHRATGIELLGERMNAAPLLALYDALSRVLETTFVSFQPPDNNVL